MLYVTTRNQQNPVTVNHTLHHSRGEDSGFWVPFRAPCYSLEYFHAMKEQSPNKTIADVLNDLFGTSLNAWDVDFCIGRYPVRLTELTGQLIIGEPWHNPKWTFDNLVTRLSKLIGADQVTNWMQVAVRIAVLFGIYGELLHKEILHPGQGMDVAVLSGNFTDPMSAWYARDWGLPIENIVCCCNENNSVWNLIAQGQMRTDVQAFDSCIPEADIAIPEELERFISAAGDPDEVNAYLQCCTLGRMYVPKDTTLAKLRKGFYVSVVSSQRIRRTISGVYNSHGYLISPDGALIYAGLQDYRARWGQIRPSIVMTHNSPVCNADFVSEAAGISKDKI